MSALSLMEWNAKHPMQWDWENLIMLNSSAENNVKKMQSVPDWEIDDGEKGIDSGGGGSLYSSGSGGSGSGSDLGLARSFSKSSKSASINSSSIGDVRMSNFSLEDSDSILEDSSNKNVYTAKANGGSSAALEGCVGSGEPLLGLKLGKRTYFEDVCAGSNTKTTSSTSFSVIPGSSVSPTKKSKASSQASPAPRCQVEGCNLDLSSAKDYHRKHRVCESHSKCPKVIVAGLERRFCQQCSRFHGLSEFDEKKRSCRRRLSDHNARRRKPQPDSIQLNPSRLSSSLYDERQPMNLVWDRAPIVHARSSASLTWEGTSTPKFTITKEYVPKPPKIRDIDRQYHLTDNELTSIPMHPHNSKSLLPSKAKVTTVEALNQGLEDSITTTVDATHDLQRALSLLSTNSWNSCEPKSISHEQSAQTSHTGMPHSVLQSMPQSLPVSSSDYWRSEQPTTSSRVHNLASQNDSGSYFQEYQLFRSPYDSDFYPSQLN